MPTSKFVIKSWNRKDPTTIKEDTFFNLKAAQSAYNFESARPGRAASMHHLDLDGEPVKGGV